MACPKKTTAWLPVVLDIDNNVNYSTAVEIIIGALDCDIEPASEINTVEDLADVAKQLILANMAKAGINKPNSLLEYQLTVGGMHLAEIYNSWCYGESRISAFEDVKKANGEAWIKLINLGGDFLTRYAANDEHICELAGVTWFENYAFTCNLKQFPAYQDAVRKLDAFKQLGITKG